MKIKRKKKLTANVALLGVGHYTYWEQFDGLLAELMEKLDVLKQKLENNSVNVTNLGMSDCAETAYEKLQLLKQGNFDILFIDMLTYATSSSIGIIFKELNIPIILVALQPLNALDYANANTYMQLCNDDICSLPEFTGVAIRMGKNPPPVIIGTRNGDVQADSELKRWCSIAHVLHDLKRARIGHMGHVLESMLDMHTDPTAVTATFGCHVVQVEPKDIMCHLKDLQPVDIAKMKTQILSFFDTPDPRSDPLTEKLTDEDLDIASRVAVALKKFTEAKDLDGFAYYYEGAANTEEHQMVTNLIVGNSLLTSAGFPMCGEFDLKTCIAMMIMDRLEIGGSFAEFHPIDFANDSILVGHDGPHHLNIAHGKPVIRSLKKYHGKPGKGAGVEFNIRKGPITMLSIGINAEGNFKFIIAEGESIDGSIPPTGNTNTHGRFKPDVRTFLSRWVKEGPTHHFALGVGHHAQTIADIANVLGVEYTIV